MSLTLLIWFVLEQTDSPFMVALVGFFAFAPTLLLGAFGGLLADRVDRRRLLITTASVSLAVTVAMTVILNTDLARFWQAYIVIFATGAGWSLDMPSRRATIHDLLGDSAVTNGIALESVGMYSSRMFGPALAGGLIALVNVSGGFVVASVFYVVTVAMMLSLRLKEDIVTGLTPGVAPGGHGPDSRIRAGIPLAGVREIFENLAQGFRYVRGQNVILATVLVTALMNLLMFPYQQMAPVIARDTLNVGPGLMGVLLAAEGIGSMVGAFAIASFSNFRYLGRVYVGGTMLSMVCLLVFSFSRHYGLSLAVLVVLGLGGAAFGTMQATIVILAARTEMRGRALGIISLAIGMMPLGSLMVGGIATATSPTFAIGLTAVVGLVLVGAVAILMPVLRGCIMPDESHTQKPEEPAASAADV
jgi:MFS family permease